MHDKINQNQTIIEDQNNKIKEQETQLEDFKNQLNQMESNQQKNEKLQKDLESLQAANDNLSTVVAFLETQGNNAEENQKQLQAMLETFVNTMGQEIQTVMKSGLVEVTGVVKADENGNPDWIVTNPDGEKYAVPHAKFIKRYELVVGSDGKHAPIGSPIEAIQVNEDITFGVPWGENGTPIPFNLNGGGYLVISNLNDIYGIQQQEF